MATQANWTDSFKGALAYRPLQYMILLFVVIGLILWVGISMGKSQMVGRQAEYPKGETIADAWIRLQAPGIINVLTDALIGIGIITGSKGEALKPLVTISDAQLVYVYNEYNNRNHPGKPTETLYTDIKGDYFGWDVFEAGELKNQIMARMSGLNLL